MKLTTRREKNAKLTSDELDDNFLYLESLFKTRGSVTISIEEYNNLFRYKEQIDKGLVSVTITHKNEKGDDVSVDNTLMLQRNITSPITEILNANRNMLKLLEGKNSEILNSYKNGKLPYKRPSLWQHIKDWFKNSLWQ